jgi:transmembrane sensor
LEIGMQNIDSIIEAYLSGQLKDEEIKMLTDFISFSNANKYYFSDYIRKWLPLADKNVEHSWDQLKSRISRSGAFDKQFPLKSNIRLYVSRIAAVLVAGLILGGLFSLLTVKFLEKNENTFVFNSPKGEKSIITLPDSSKIWLNGGTDIKLSKSFGITNRNIYLNGEAYFEVAKNKLLPFKVVANDIDIKVTGTKFNVSAYSDRELIETTIKEGTVQLEAEDKKAFKKFQLTANQEAIYNRTSSKMVLKTANVDIITSWKNNVLIIENENYAEVFRKLENWYGVNITIDGKLDYEPNYTLTIKTESLNEILQLIHFITPFKYTIEGEKVHIFFKPKK